MSRADHPALARATDRANKPTGEQIGGSARAYEIPGPITLREARFSDLQIPND